MASITTILSLKWRLCARQHPLIKRLLALSSICLTVYLLVSILNRNPDQDVRDTSGLVVTKQHHAFLVVLILTGPRYFERRDTIRQTWLAELPRDVKVFFVIGTDQMEPQEIGTLQYEHTRYGDLLLLPHLKDSYFNLTSKVLKSFHWLDLNVEFDFVFKADDDTYARMDVLYKELKMMKPEKTYWGFFDGRAKVKRSGQWEEKKWILCDRYLPHAKGGGYLLSSDLVHFISYNAPLLQIFNSEDVAVGTWLAGLDIKRIHDSRFDTEYMSRGCSNKYIVTHKQDIVRIKENHENILKTSRLCGREFKVRDSYEYNWNVPSSLCCTRNISDTT